MHAVVGPLNAAPIQFGRIAAGDLTERVRIDRQGEMGCLLEDLTRMQTVLTDTVHQMCTGSESIGAVTEQIAAGNADLS